MIFNDKIDVFELYNFAVHQCYIIYWQHWNIKFKELSHTFWIHFNTFFIVTVFIFKLSRNFLSGFKNCLKRKDRPSRALQFCCTSNSHYMMALYWKIHLKKFCPYISHILWLWRHLHFKFVKDWFILNWRFQQQCFSARWDLSFDIHIGGGPGGVFNFIVSNLGEDGIKKLISDSDSGAPTTPGRSRKVKNLTMNN